MAFFLGFFSTFVATIFSFVATTFLIVACCYCRDKPFLYPDIVLLSCTAETELCVATNSKDVATYFLIRSLSQVELLVATLKSLSRQTCLGLSHLSSIFCRDIIFFCHDKNLLLCNFYCRDINFIFETNYTAIVAIEIIILRHCGSKSFQSFSRQRFLPSVLHYVAI